MFIYARGQKRDSDYGKDAFDLTTRLLRINPEFYTVWNYRRNILLNGLFLSRYVLLELYAHLRQCLTWRMEARHRK